jgi:hypothetical protein
MFTSSLGDSLTLLLLFAETSQNLQVWRLSFFSVRWSTFFRYGQMDAMDRSLESGYRPFSQHPVFVTVGEISFGVLRNPFFFSLHALFLKMC